MDPSSLIQHLLEAKLTEQEIATALTDDGVPVTQATINRIKNGKQQTSFAIGMGLTRLAQRRLPDLAIPNS